MKLRMLAASRRESDGMPEWRYNSMFDMKLSRLYSLCEFMCTNLSGPEQSLYDHGKRACLVGMSLPLGQAALLNNISVDHTEFSKIMRHDSAAL